MYKGFAAAAILFALIVAMMAGDLPKGGAEQGNAVEASPDNGVTIIGPESANASAQMQRQQTQSQQLPGPDVFSAPLASATQPTLVLGGPTPAQTQSEDQGTPVAGPPPGGAPFVFNPIPPASELGGKVLMDTTQHDKDG
jgi:hypothetical protein